MLIRGRERYICERQRGRRERETLARERRRRERGIGKRNCWAERGGSVHHHERAFWMQFEHQSKPMILV